MLNPQVKFTYSDYLLLPEGDRQELIEGEFYVAPAPSFKHQQALANLNEIFRDFVRRNRLGTVILAPFDVVLSDDTIVQPDLTFVSNERHGIITENNLSGAPDLVIEILSLSTASRDRGEKMGIYATSGVREYWLVDLEEKSVQVLGLGSEGYSSITRYTTGKAFSSVIDGFETGLSEVFAP